jgi:hypothetical protein
MPLYYVELTETWTRSVYVTAGTEAEAVALAQDGKWDHEEEFSQSQEIDRDPHVEEVEED